MKILLTEDAFAIETSDGQQGEFVDYGEVATLTVHATSRYIALCDDPDGTPELYSISSAPRKLEAREFETEDVEVEGDEVEVEDEEDDESEEG